MREQLQKSFGDLPRVFWAVCFGIFINRVGSFVAPFLAVYLVQDRGFQPADAGRVVALYGVGITLSGPLGGALADRIGRRATMLFGLVGGAIAVGLLAFANNPHFIILLAFLAPALGDTYRPAASAAVSDVVETKDRARAFSLVYWATNLGMATGLTLGGLVAGKSLTTLFLLDAAATLAFAVTVLRFVPETRPAPTSHDSERSSLADVITDRPFLAFLLLHLGALVVFNQWLLALPLDMAAHGFGPASFSVLMGLNCLGVVLIQPILSPRLARFDSAHLLAVMTVLFGLGYAVNALGGNLAIYILGTTLWTVGEVVGFPVAATIVADLAPVALRGRYQGAFGMTWGVAITLSPMIAGEVFERFGANTLWIGCLVVATGIAVGQLAAGKARNQRLATLRQ